ncbi:MAG: hypothetical protein K5685_09710 [Bacteroidales bacterium]|nr:hypothetical protein [Bacteroidales bacterium]
MEKKVLSLLDAYSLIGEFMPLSKFNADTCRIKIDRQGTKKQGYWWYIRVRETDCLLRSDFRLDVTTFAEQFTAKKSTEFLMDELIYGILGVHWGQTRSWLSRI